jgi:hypothetical protein
MRRRSAEVRSILATLVMTIPNLSRACLGRRYALAMRYTGGVWIVKFGWCHVVVRRRGATVASTSGARRFASTGVVEAFRPPYVGYGRLMVIKKIRTP